MYIQIKIWLHSLLLLHTIYSHCLWLCLISGRRVFLPYLIYTLSINHHISH